MAETQASEGEVGYGENCEIQVRHVRPHNNVKIEYGLKTAREDKSCALVVKRQYKETNILRYTSLQVNSPYLLRIIKAVIGSYPTVRAKFDKPFVIYSPFQMLYHYWDELHALSDTGRIEDTTSTTDVDNQAREKSNFTLDDKGRLHLNLLLEFMRYEMEPSREQVGSMLKTGSISFKTLWTIFRPGELIYLEEDGHPWLLRLVQTAYEENTRAGEWLELHLEYNDYDGQSYGSTSKVVEIFQKRSFAAENPSAIDKLPAYPARWLRNRADVEARLAERGARFLAIKGMQVRAYNGIARYHKEAPESYYDPSMAEFTGVWLPYTESARIILDRKTFDAEYHLQAVSLVATDIHTPSGRMLCPPYAVGYSIVRKDWCRFYVDHISDINWNKSAIDSLVLQEDRKAVLEALVLSHAFPDTSTVRDQAKQKGKGLIILLHGSPGSGKTLTAESMAEASGRALITATLGELNRDGIPCYFEQRLKKLLQCATIWRAVVLLDEADVFLEGRADAAPEHNALVALFLKHLEYFSGILFLTSNRVRVFDSAMKSRIHLALEYRPPGREMRRRLWAGCLAAIPSADRELDSDEDGPDIARFLDDDVNGREIANSVNTACTLARFRGVRLRADHVETVLQTRRDFEKRLDSLRRRAQDQRPPTGSGPPPSGSFQLARRGTLETEDSD